MRVALTVCRGGQEIDVAVQGPPGACFGDVRAELARVCDLAPGTTLWSGARAVEPGDLLGGPRLLAGCRLTSTPPSHADRAGGAFALTAVGGPHAGREIPLDRPCLTLGRAAGCDVLLDDPDTSRRHAEVRLGYGWMTIRDLGSSNGTLLDGAPLGAAPAALTPGSLIRIGNNLLTLDDATPRTDAMARASPAADPVTLRRAAKLSTSRGWEPAPGNPLEVRLGLSAAPLLVDLRDGALALTGPAAVTAGLARWVIGQLAVRGSPAWLRIVLLVTPDAVGRWRWCRWLPQADARVVIGAPGCAELVGELTTRRPDDRWTVVLVDVPGGPAAVSGLSTVIRDGRRHGVTAVAVASRTAPVGAACRTVAQVAGDTGTLLSVSDSSGMRVAAQICVPDQVDLTWADDVARALAPLGEADAPDEPDGPVRVTVLDDCQSSSSSGPIS